MKQLLSEDQDLRFKYCALMLEAHCEVMLAVRETCRSNAFTKKHMMIAMPVYAWMSRVLVSYGEQSRSSLDMIGYLLGMAGNDPETPVGGLHIADYVCA